MPNAGHWQETAQSPMETGESLKHHIQNYLSMTGFALQFQTRHQEQKVLKSPKIGGFCFFFKGEGQKHTNVHSSIIHHSPEVEATQMSMSW